METVAKKMSTKLVISTRNKLIEQQACERNFDEAGNFWEAKCVHLAKKSVPLLQPMLDK